MLFCLLHIWLATSDFFRHQVLSQFPVNSGGTLSHQHCMSTKQFSIYPIRTRIMFVSVRKKFVSHSFAFCRIDTCSLSSHHFVNYALASMLGGSLVTTAWHILRL